MLSSSRTNPSSSQNPKILCIEDDANFRAVLAGMLRKKGFEPLLAEDGEQGMAVARRIRPDLVLCDLEMPNMDGYEVLTAFQRDPLLAPIPFIFLTGQAEPARVRQGMNLGADDYLTKPLDPKDFFNAIDARLARAAFRQGSQESDPRNTPGSASVLVKTTAEKQWVPFQDITHVLAYGEYSWVYWRQSRGAMVRKSLKQWVAELPKEYFLRVHRRAIINLSQLDKVERQSDGGLQVRLRGVADAIDVSVRLAPALNRKLRAVKKV